MEAVVRVWRLTAQNRAREGCIHHINTAETSSVTPMVRV